MSTITSEIRLRVRAEGDKVLADLGTKLNSLANQATLSSNNFKGLADELKKVQQTTIQSARNIKDYSASWRELASSVDISSKEFKQATAEAARLDAQLAKIQGTSVRTAAAVQTAMSGPVTGGTAGAGIMGRPAEPLAPRVRLGFETLDPEFWRKRQENIGGAMLDQPRPLDYGATDKALGNLQDSLQNVRDVENRSRIERLQLQEKFNNLEIQKQDQHAAKVLAKDRENADIGGRDFMQRLENREKQTSQRRQRFAGAAQTVGAVAASGIFGGPEGLVGAGIGAAFGPQGALVGGAIGAQVGMLRQALGATGDYVAELSKLRIALAGVSKDQADYEKNLSNVNKLSNQFLLPLKDTTQQYTKLQASVAGAGLSTKETETVFKGISAAIIATGGTTEDLNSALRATSQVFSKGKVSAEELRQQIGERLPGAFTIFAASLNKTPQELDKALEDGKVTLNDFLKFSEELFKRYGKTASIIADAPQNAGARLTIALDKLNIEIGRFIQPIGAQFQSLATGIVNALTPAINAFAELMDAPKLLANQRLPQIDRQLKVLKSDLKGAQALPELGGGVGNVQRALKTRLGESIKTLEGERKLTQAIISQTGSGTGTPPPTAGGGAGAGGGANKAAKDGAEARMQENANKLQATFDKQKLAILQGISDAQLKINILKVDENNENREATANKIVDFKLAIADRQYELKKKELNLNSYKDKLKINLEDNVQLRNAKLKANQQALSTDLTKLEIDNTTEINAIYTNQTDNLKKQTDEKQKFLKELDKEIKLYAQSGNQAKEEMELRMRMRNAKPRELEAALEDAAIRRQTKELRDQKQQEFTDQGFTGDDITLKLKDLDAAGIKRLEAAEGTRRLKQQMEDLNATDFTQGIRNGVTTYLESIGTLSENVKDVTGSALQGLGDQLANFVTTGKASFADLANSIIKDMIRITTQQLIMKPLLGVLGSIFPGSSGVANGTLAPTDMFKYVNNAKGNLYAENGIQPFARGGIVDKPTLFPFAKGTGLMGEAGPEAIIPLRRGRDGNLGVAGGGGGGSTSVVVNVDAKGSNVEGDTPKGQQLGRALSQAVQAELLKQKRPGGLLS